MEDVYTVKIKTKPDTRNVYPSERRYSASTVSGLAWVHIALAATSFLLASLAIINPNSDVTRLNVNDTIDTLINESETISNLAESNTTYNNETKQDSENLNSTNPSNDNSYILVVAPILLTIFALAAGVASIMASVRWYIDRNITWLFLVSILSTIISFTSLIMVAVWFVKVSDGDIRDFYKDSNPFADYLVLRHSDVVSKNDSHFIVKNSHTTEVDNSSNMFTKRVLSVNILIACFLELLWSMLTVKIAYKGMKNTYKDDVEHRGNCVSVVTKIKGNNPNLLRNGKFRTKPMINYPSKMKKVFLVQNANGFFLKNQNNKAKNTETSSEFCKERMMNFLNRCAMEGVQNDLGTCSEQSDLNTIQEVKVEVNKNEDLEVKDRMTPISWGDTPNHTIYNQNTLNLEKIFNFVKKEEEKERRMEELNAESEKKDDESKTEAQ